MANNANKTFKNTLSGSVGAGMGSLFSPGGRKYYILEHKVTSKYHRAGESQEIIVDNIQIGRDSVCQVRFDENFKTVSRRHAAIVREGENWKLVQLSQTNRTFLNGYPVKNEWYLQNGDEIQLSVNGPKLGFIIPTGNKATVGSIGLTRRMSLFRQQALRPYKTAITVMAVCLLLAVGGLGTWNFMLKDDLSNQGKILAQQIEENKNNAEKADSLANELVTQNQKIADYEDRIAKLQNDVKQANASAAAAWKKASEVQVSGGVAGSAELTECAKNAYFCLLYVFVGDQLTNENFWTGSSGTAFLLDDGRLVTAQHVIDPIGYPSLSDDEGFKKSLLMQLYPDQFTCKFLAVSPTGDKYQKVFKLNNSPFRVGSSKLDVIGTVELEGMSVPVKCHAGGSDTDWAWINIGRSGGLPYDNSLSKSMPIKTHLDILGYPMGVGAENLSNVSPIFSESSVAREGLDTDGCILLSNSETDHGNSGGPVFTVKDGKYVVVGILTGANRLGSKTDPSSVSGDTKMKDRVVPIANAR